MKKLLFIGVVLSVFAAACNSVTKRDNGTYTIHGTLKGIPSGTVKLVSHNSAQRTHKAIDSTTISDGTFTLKGKVDVPQMMSLQIQPGNWSFGIFVEDTTLTITADTAGSKHFDYSAYGGGKGAKIINYNESGSKYFDTWMAYKNDPRQHQFDSQSKKIDENIKKYTKLGAKTENSAYVDTEYAYRDKLDSLNKIQNTWKYHWIDSLASKNPSSVAGAFLFERLYTYSLGMKYDKAEHVVNKFRGEAKASIYYQNMDSLLMTLKAVQPGSTAPDFTLLQRDSTKFTLSSFRGNYVMIDFWASWCHPCRKAIPHWKKIYHKYHDKGFNIVSVSDDSRWSDWEKALDEEKMPWKQVCDEFPVKNMPARVGSLYMTHYIPFYVLIDRKGKILAYTGKEDRINVKLKDIFGY